MGRLPPDDEDDLRRRWKANFDRFDLDHNGSLSFDEVRAVLDDAELPTTRRQVQKLFDAIDSNRDGKVDLEEFMVFASRRRRTLRRAFESMLSANDDDVETSTLTAQHLRVASEKAGLPLSDRDVRDIMRRIDQTGRGRVTFDEFVRYSMLVPHVNPHAFFDQWFRDTWNDGAIPEFEIARETRTQEGETFAAAASRKLVCGGAAGVISRTLTAPLDRLRLLMMTTARPIGAREALTLATTNPPNIGFRGLWMGNGMNCIKIAPEMGIKMFSFDVLKQKVAADPDNITASEQFVAGGIAGAMAEVSVYPMEVVRTRIATGAYGSLRECLASLSQGGASAFYAGVVPSVVGIIPFAAIDLTINSILKDKAARYLQGKGEEISVPLLLSCGMLSSATATVVTFPLNVVRTVAQATAKPIKDIILTLKQDGLHGFYRGMLPCLLKVMPATSISYASYEWLKTRWESA
mmetsp:Transcript_12050/g.26092  ORF Transcript_12050/g.26092 Transcript_12050/m.26092 type:complete len:464 (-) Transcript_12050:72-1463(-)